MTPSELTGVAIDVALVRDFLATYDRHDPADRVIAARLIGLLHGESYRRERERYPEFVDLGGEA